MNNNEVKNKEVNRKVRIAFEMLKTNTNGAIAIKDIDTLANELYILEMEYQNSIKKLKANPFQ